MSHNGIVVTLRFTNERLNGSSMFFRDS